MILGLKIEEKRQKLIPVPNEVSNNRNGKKINQKKESKKVDRKNEIFAILQFSF